jgi:hypothetical protein
MILKVITITFFTVYTILAIDMATTIVKHKKSNQPQSDSTNYVPTELDEDLN